MSDIISDIKYSIGSKQNIDAAIFVTKATNYRNSIRDQIAIKTISKMIVNSKPDDIFMIITHCD